MNSNRPLQLTTGTFDHFLCGTCVGERERRAGMFEGGRRVRMVVGVEVLPGREMGCTQYCCVCGGATEPYARCQLSADQDLCDGVHEPFEP